MSDPQPTPPPIGGFAVSAVPRFRWLLPILAAVAVSPAAVGWPVAAYPDPGPPASAAQPDHLVISELVTGAVGASDEFVEIFNPTVRDLALDGLELVYVTAGGSSLTRKVGWPTTGAAVVPPGRHLLVANQAGTYASIADQLYAGGLAATGGSIALRVAGASSAVDAVGWGNAAAAWREGSAAAAAPPGASLERLPGGAAGSRQDTDDNLADFHVLETPAPENGAAGAVPLPTPVVSRSATTGAATAAPSAPVPSSPAPSAPGDTGPPGPTPSPLPAPTSDPSSADGSTPPTTPSVAPSPPVTPSPVPSSETTPSPSATPEPVTAIADARALSDGSQVTVIGVSLTDSAFSDGGGYLADPTGGIAVIGGPQFSRGYRLRVVGTISDRYRQRTLRAASVTLLSETPADEPLPTSATTSELVEALEGQLVATRGIIVSGPESLSGGVAYGIDDGTGQARVVVGVGTGIDLTGWVRGADLQLVGVLGQRDSSGTGTSGYRLQVRDPADVLDVVPPTPAPETTPTPIPSSSPAASGSRSAVPSATPTAAPASAPLVTVGAARALPTGARVRLRGVVTLGPGLVDDTTAIVQDATGAIELRLGTVGGALRRGQLVEVEGTRSTRAGMLTLRVVTEPRQLGRRGEPAAPRIATGDAAESLEARLVRVIGRVASSPTRASTGSVSFGVDDGSGELRATVPAAVGLRDPRLVRGAMVELVGALRQQTTASQPERGYRLWLRAAADLRVGARPAAAPSGTRSTSAGPRHTSSGPLAASERTPGGVAAGGSPSPPPSGQGAPRPQLVTRRSSSSRPAASRAPQSATRTASAAPGPAWLAIVSLCLALASFALLAALAARTGALTRLRARWQARPAALGSKHAEASSSAAVGSPDLTLVSPAHDPERAPPW